MGFIREAKERAKVLSLFLFLMYLILLGYLLFFSPHFGRTGINSFSYNLVPLRTITNYIKYRAYVNFDIIVINILGNILAFIPMGFFVPLIFRAKRTFFGVMLFSAFISLTIEVLQYKFSVGNFDIDDIILNTLGGIIGYILFGIIYLIYRKTK